MWHLWLSHLSAISQPDSSQQLLSSTAQFSAIVTGRSKFQKLHNFEHYFLEPDSVKGSIPVAKQAISPTTSTRLNGSGKWKANSYKQNNWQSWVNESCINLAQFLIQIYNECSFYSLFRFKGLPDPEIWWNILTIPLFSLQFVDMQLNRVHLLSKGIVSAIAVVPWCNEALSRLDCQWFRVPLYRIHIIWKIDWLN